MWAYQREQLAGLYRSYYRVISQLSPSSGSSYHPDVTFNIVNNVHKNDYSSLVTGSSIHGFNTARNHCIRANTA